MQHDWFMYHLRSIYKNRPDFPFNGTYNILYRDHWSLDQWSGVLEQPVAGLYYRGRYDIQCLEIDGLTLKDG